MTAEPPGRRGMGSGSEPESAPSRGSRGGVWRQRETNLAHAAHPSRLGSGAGPLPAQELGRRRGINMPGRHSTVVADATPSKDCVLRVHLQWFVFCFVFFCCTTGMWDLSSPTRDRTCAPGIGSMES